MPQPEMADEPASSPQECWHCSVPVPDLESQDRKGRYQDTPAKIRGGELPLAGQASGGRSDHIGQAPFPNETETQQTCRQTSGLSRRTGGPKRGRLCRSAGGSDAANPRPSAAPNRFRSGVRDSETAHTESEQTPGETPVVSTARAHGHKHGPFLVPPGL